MWLVTHALLPEPYVIVQNHFYEDYQSASTNLYILLQCSLSSPSYPIIQAFFIDSSRDHQRRELWRLWQHPKPENSGVPSSSRCRPHQTIYLHFFSLMAVRPPFPHAALFDVMLNSISMKNRWLFGLKAHLPQRQVLLESPSSRGMDVMVLSASSSTTLALFCWRSTSQRVLSCLVHTGKRREQD